MLLLFSQISESLLMLPSCMLSMHKMLSQQTAETKLKPPEHMDR